MSVNFGSWDEKQVVRLCKKRNPNLCRGGRGSCFFFTLHISGRIDSEAEELYYQKMRHFQERENRDCFRERGECPERNSNYESKEMPVGALG